MDDGDHGPSRLVCARILFFFELTDPTDTQLSFDRNLSYLKHGIRPLICDSSYGRTIGGEVGNLCALCHLGGGEECVYNLRIVHCIDHR